MLELVFEVIQKAEGGYVACAIGDAIVTQADTLDELCRNLLVTSLCHFENQS